MLTVGRIANGAIIEREIDFALNRLPNLRLALRNADFTTAKRIASAVNDFIGIPAAEPLDPSTVQLSIPKEYHGKVVALLTEIEQLQIETDMPAKYHRRLAGVDVKEVVRGRHSELLTGLQRQHVGRFFVGACVRSSRCRPRGPCR